MREWSDCGSFEFWSVRWGAPVFRRKTLGFCVGDGELNAGNAAKPRAEGVQYSEGFDFWCMGESLVGVRLCLGRSMGVLAMRIEWLEGRILSERAANFHNYFCAIFFGGLRGRKSHAKALRRKEMRMQWIGLNADLLNARESMQ